MRATRATRVIGLISPAIIIGCAGSQSTPPRQSAVSETAPRAQAPAKPDPTPASAPTLPPSRTEPAPAPAPKTATAPATFRVSPATEPMPLPPWWVDGPQFEGEDKQRVRIATIGEGPTLSLARRHAVDAGRSSVRSLLQREPRQVITERVWTTPSEHGFRVYVLTMGE